MKIPGETPENPNSFDHDAQGYASEAAPENSGLSGHPEPVDIVHAEVVADPRPSRKGKQGAALRRGTEIKRVRGYETRRRLIEMHVFGGKRLVECARLLGLSYGRVLGVWHAVVAEVHGSKGAPEEHLRAVRAYLDLNYRRVVEESQARLGEAASYGAAVIAACKALVDLHGLNEDASTPNATTLEDVGREVRVVSPLLMDKLERIKQLTNKSPSGGDPQSATCLTVSGVPVEGAVVSAVLKSGGSSPLLDGSAHERMVSGLMRMGERAVKRAQMDGADVALDSIPAPRIDK